MSSRRYGHPAVHAACRLRHAGGCSGCPYLRSTDERVELCAPVEDVCAGGPVVQNIELERVARDRTVRGDEGIRIAREDALDPVRQSGCAPMRLGQRMLAQL